MADEPAVRATEPEVDMSKIQTAVSAAVSTALNEAAQRNAVQQREQQELQQQQDAARRNAENPDPVAAVLKPHLDPLANLMSLKADDAKDASIFYATRPEMAKHSGQIEAKFNELAKAGRPLNRASIAQWIMGSPEFLDQRIKERDAELARAREAQTLTGSRGGLPTARPEVDINASDDDLSRALIGSDGKMMEF